MICQALTSPAGRLVTYASNSIFASSQKVPATSLLTSPRHRRPTTTRRAPLQSGKRKFSSATCNTPKRAGPCQAWAGTAAIARFTLAVSLSRNR